MEKQKNFSKPSTVHQQIKKNTSSVIHKAKKEKPAQKPIKTIKKPFLTQSKKIQQKIKGLDLKIGSSQALQKLQTELIQLKKTHQYLQAEFANYKRNAEKNRQETSLYANSVLIQELLTNVLNDFNRAMASSPDNTNTENFKKGIQMIHSQFLKYLKKHGVQELSPQGEIFDPHFHEVLSTEIKPDLPENTVLHVCKKGYKLNDRLIQPAQVIVSQKSK